MQHAQSGVELLTTLDDELATDLAKEAQSLNIQRQNIVEEITKQALHKLEQEPKHLVNVVAGSDWHEGVLGIESFGRKNGPADFGARYFR